MEVSSNGLLCLIRKAIGLTMVHVDSQGINDGIKKDSAPGPDGIPYGVYRCAGGLGSKFLFHA